MRVTFAQKSKSGIKGCHKHSHDCYEFIVTTAGTSKTHLEKTVFDVKQGSIVILPPGTWHWHSSEEGFSDICFHTDKAFFAPDRPVCYLDTSNTLVQLAEMIYMNYLQKDYNYETINLKLLETVCEYVTRLQGGNRKSEFVWKFKELLTQNISNPTFRIADASRQMGVHFDYMRHCFKAEVGQTPLEYLTYIRIRQAKRLLEHNLVYRVSEIAEMCGYTDPFYFSKTFKALVGISPKAYRESTISRK